MQCYIHDKHYKMKEEIITGDFYEKYKGKQPNWGFNGLGYVVYKRTYARKIDNGKRTEEWHETVKRCVDWLYQQHQKMGIDLPAETYEDMYDKVFNLKMNFSGRMLWQAGTKTVDKLGGASQCNCWSVVANSKKAFLNVFDYLMLGGGVGYNLQKKYVDALPEIKGHITVTHQDGNDADFIVPDSREGWVSLLDKVLTSFFETGQSFTYSTHLVRPKGEPINGFGGTASGPEPLNYGIGEIVKILQRKEGGKLEPIDVLDIMNILGSIVVAGNVRRSAQIALGDPDDLDFLRAKRWDLYDLPHWRAMSNNTVVTDDIDKLPSEFWEGYKGNGEPYGLFNLPLVKEKGRVKDFHRADPNATGTNPCSEITLAGNENGGAESCNLAEIYMNNLENEEEFETVAKYCYIATKTIAMLPYHDRETEKIIHNHYRVGIGLTGIAQSPELASPEILEDVYRGLEQYDLWFSKRLAINPSIKLTTIKPSGTLSLLAGSTPGLHPAHNDYYIRRVRVAADDSIAQMCEQAGYNVEYVKQLDGSIDEKTKVIDFPIHESSGVPKRHDWDAITQLEVLKYMQKWWSDNQVSITVSYKPEEIPAIQEWLRENYSTNVKSVSFLMSMEHGFAQAPYEDITEEKYNELYNKLKPLNYGKKIEEHVLAEDEECDKGGCPVR